MNPKTLIVKFKILGRTWRLRLLTKKQYKKKNGKDSLAVTKGWKRLIDLSPKGQDLETIIHEILHAYLWEMCCKGTVESEDGLEEFVAELLSKRGYELLALAKSLRHQVKLLTS